MPPDPRILADVTPCAEHAERLKTMERLVESLADVPADLARLVRAVVGDEEMGTRGLVARVTDLETLTQSLRDNRIWLLGAATGIGFVSGTIGSVLTFYLMMRGGG